MNKLRFINKPLILTAVLTLVLGIGGGYWLAVIKQNSVSFSEKEIAKTSAQKPKILFYRAPMNPAVTSPVPMKDEMNMDYIPVYAEENTAAEPTNNLKIDPVTTQNMGVRTVIAKKSSLAHLIQAAGRISYDEEHLVRLHPKVEGWIETLQVAKTAEKVVKNQSLLQLYSPQIVSSQQEYLLALDNLQILAKSPFTEIQQGAEQLLESSRKRLQFLDLPNQLIKELTRTHQVKKTLPIQSPGNGIVMTIGARQGQYVTPETELYTIADLSKVWVYAQIYEYELPWVKQGDWAEMRLAAVPERIFKGRIGFIYPYAEEKTRTIKVRLVFDNKELLLKPELFAEVTIYAGKQAEQVVIPIEAVIRSGTKNQVFVVREKGKFEPREIVTGLSSNGEISVLKGLNAGEEVVTSAQFLLDSESKLNEATAKMIEPSAPQKTEPNRLQREQGAHQHD